ncbi:MAG: TonB-dependent receptor [Ignavibacteriales bacterium]|nr:TonB-dependent receptor [Ignavibacteriales bacterium]
MHSIRHILLQAMLPWFVLTAHPLFLGSDTVATKPQARLYAMPEFVVSATRWQVSVQQLPSSATVLTSADIAARNGTSLASALEGVPGLLLKSYGGPGSVSTTSLRGMGAEHTLVLVNGQRYNNVRDGQVDFGIFLLQNVDRVEILRGGYSAIYGADALGGIVNIVTRRSSGHSSVSGEFTEGSYGLNGQAFNAELTLGGMGLQIAAKREAGAGNYAFSFNDGITSSTLQRQNADYSISQLQVLLDVPIALGVSLSVRNLMDWADRGSPGAVLSVASSNRARLRDGGFLTQATMNWTVKPALTLRLSTLFNVQRRQYVDPLSAGGPDDQQSEFADKTITLTPHLQYVLSTRTSVSVGAEYSHSTISSRQIDGVDRDQQSAFLSLDHVMDLPGDFLYQFNFYPSVRFDHFSDVAGAVDPRLGVNIGLWRSQELRLKTSIGKSFRAPTFYDLYWKTGGNPDLKPEHSVSFDAGLALSIDFLGSVELEGNYFDIRTKDRIVWTPDPGGLWSPKNLQSVRSDGVEVIASWRFLQRHVVLRGSYSNSETKKVSAESSGDQTADKQLPFIPREMASVSLSLDLGVMSVNVNHLFTGYRFSTETNDPFFVLPGYHKTDGNVSLRLTERPFISTIRMEVTNIFNANYQMFPNFPMPRRAFAFKVLLDY